jgi:hypothetical protein
MFNAEVRKRLQVRVLSQPRHGVDLSATEIHVEKWRVTRWERPPNTLVTQMGGECCFYTAEVVGSMPTKGTKIGMEAIVANALV